MGAHFSATTTTATTTTIAVHKAASNSSCFVKFNWKHFESCCRFCCVRVLWRKWVRAHSPTTHMLLNEIKPYSNAIVHTCIWFNFSRCALFLSAALTECRYQMDIDVHRSITWWTSLRPLANTYKSKLSLFARRNVNELQAPEICMIESRANGERCKCTMHITSTAPVDGIASKDRPLATDWNGRRKFHPSKWPAASDYAYFSFLLWTSCYGGTSFTY